MRSGALHVLLGLFLLAAPARAGATEDLHYHWRLQGFLGAIAGLFFPHEGFGQLTTTTLENGHLRCELVITAEDKGPDFWRYGAELDPVAGHTVRAWTSYHFRDRERAEESQLDANTEKGVVDIASSINVLRRNPVKERVEWHIWSDGKLYPVEVVPGPVEGLRIAGRQVPARHYWVRGIELPGERLWKGHLELWLALDEVSTPVRILVERSFASVLLELQPGGPAADEAPFAPASPPSEP